MTINAILNLILASTNNLQTRITRLFSNALQNDDTQLSSLYGAIAGLGELGTEVIKVFIVPRLKFIASRIDPLLNGANSSNVDKIAADHIKNILYRICAPAIMSLRSQPDVADDYM